MFADFALRMTQTLTERGFACGQNVRDVLQTAEGTASAFSALPMLTYTRQDGAILYVVALFNAPALGAADFFAREAQLAQSLADFGARVNCRSIVLFSAAVHNAPTVWLDARLGNAEPYDGQPVYTLRYNLDFAAGQLRFHPDAPASMLGMDVLLSNALHGQTPSQSEIAAKQSAAKALAPKLNNEWLVYLLLVINALVLVVMELQGGSENMENLLRFGALENTKVFAENEWWRLLTAFFIHIGLPHFLHNGLSLFIFGSRIERFLGRARFLLIYFAAGFAGNLAQLLFSDVVCAGASGAIYGLMGAALAVTQATKKTLDGLSFYIMALFIVIGIVQGLMTPGIGNAAHIGGMIAGYLLTLLLVHSDKNRAAATQNV